MQKTHERAPRIASRIQRVIAETLARDFHSREDIISITAVKMSPDLSLAKVYLSAFGNSGSNTKLVTELNNKSPYYRSILGRAIKARKVPKLQFVYDESIAYAAKMDKLIDEALDEDKSHHQI